MGARSPGPPFPRSIRSLTHRRHCHARPRDRLPDCRAVPWRRGRAGGAGGPAGGDAARASSSFFELLGGRVDEPDAGFNQGTLDVTAKAATLPARRRSTSNMFTGTDVSCRAVPRNLLIDDADITLGPHTFDGQGNPVTQSARVESVSATFSIQSPTGTVTGTEEFLRRHARAPERGGMRNDLRRCQEFNDPNPDAGRAPPPPPPPSPPPPPPSSPPPRTTFSFKPAGGCVRGGFAHPT